MKRSSFFAALLGCIGIGKAQQWKGCIRDKDNPHICTTDSKPALNNQCPSCGTMAAPYKPDTRFCGDYSSGQPSGLSGLPGCEGKINIARCKRCNAAFWQDAE